MMAWKPKIIAFTCWCSNSGVDQAGFEGFKYPSNLVTLRVPCSAIVNPSLVIKAFEEGADAVLITACKPFELRRIAPSRITAARVSLLRRLLKTVGIEESRVRILWISSNEGEVFAKEVSEIVGEIEKLGPLDLRRKMLEQL
ncbi:MAG: hydrogenase iron-sulfur subunit [Crenarchaeota archaeon]|nr:hydrogenase iron-sulfur subunit [Thermoproteota archaeon]MDW8033866.1 hydrogenase iron-sulfur subunit [Nitrososphaerota archaeon]